MYLPLFVNEVHAERISRQFHQAIHGNTEVTITFIFTGTESEAIINEATGIPVIYTQNMYTIIHKSQRCTNGHLDQLLSAYSGFVKHSPHIHQHHRPPAQYGMCDQLEDPGTG